LRIFLFNRDSKINARFNLTKEENKTKIFLFLRSRRREGGERGILLRRYNKRRMYSV